MYQSFLYARDDNLAGFVLDKKVYSWGSAAQGRLGVVGEGDSPWPRPIFGSLHMVSDMASHHWNTILVAGKFHAWTTSKLCSVHY